MALTPVPVALESTVFVHGLPHPLGLQTALELEEIVRTHGAAPKTIGIVGGEVVVGLDAVQIEHLATAGSARKASWRDLAVVTSLGLDAATTVASTTLLANAAGIEVICTGGIGGVHRGDHSDVSNDLLVLERTPATIVCSGAKVILDLPATRERLETAGITVIGYGTDEFPGFYSRSTGLPVDVRCDSPAEVARVVRARRALGLSSSTLVCVPVPDVHEIPAEELEVVVGEAAERADALGIRGGRLTPFLLEAVAQATASRSLNANVALLRNNARVAAEIGLALR
jgi:pseudouridine-5'-phosphate glycosidase